jgi:GNAT superfamily N-acetyltransferase
MTIGHARTGELTVREATPADNRTLIDLERQTPLVIGDIEETFDRSPDFFAGYRLHERWRVVLAELGGRTAGVMAGVIQDPLIGGRRQRLVLIQRARVHPELRGRGVALALSNHLFAWSREHGAEGPYYLIAPENAPSISFVERGGGHWPAEIALRTFELSDSGGSAAPEVTGPAPGDAAELINATHAGHELFEPLTAESFARRLGRDPSYGAEHLYGVSAGGKLVAVAGLWDRGAIAERIQRDRKTGAVTRSRTAAVADWGFAAGAGEAFAALLRFLAGKAAALGRSGLTICEPAPGALPDPRLDSQTALLSIFTPSLPPPEKAAVRGVFADLLQL